MIIRASSLPSYSDCARKTVAQNYPKLVEEAGYALNPRSQHIAGVLGTAFHAACAVVLRAIQAGAQVSAETAKTAALESYDATLAGGIEWDNTTPEVAVLQLNRMIDSWIPYGITLKPAQVEQELTATISSDYKLRGHLDLRTEDGVIHDHKTGARKGASCASQLGGYSLLARANGLSVTGLSRDFMRRTPRMKTQDEIQQQALNVRECELAATHTIERIATELDKFKATGNPWVFNANPNTIVCGQRFCPAWGTKFCTLGESK